jgi:hypothetical protein
VQPYIFNPANSRQRSALLETSGNIYAGFGSFCDVNANLSRGWVLGWSASSLTPLPANELLNQRGVSATAHNWFLSSIWMSGAGIAASEYALYYATGNTDYLGNTYNSVTNLAESVLKMGPALDLQSFFTPSNESALDANDYDVGSGGVLVVPDHPVRQPMVVAAGKTGIMYVLNRSHLGGFNSADQVLGEYNIGGCLCAETYFQGPDGVDRVVSSGARTLIVWILPSSGPNVNKFIQESTATITTGQDPGFFTAVSSNGITAGTPVIWAVCSATIWMGSRIASGRNVPERLFVASS